MPLPPPSSPTVFVNHDRRTASPTSREFDAHWRCAFIRHATLSSSHSAFFAAHGRLTPVAWRPTRQRSAAPYSQPLRVRAELKPNEQPHNPGEEAPASQPTRSPPPPFYSAWRAPRWLSHERDGKSAPQFPLPPPVPPIKLASGLAVVLGLAALWLSYIKLNAALRESVSISAQQLLDRRVSVGRVVRLSPFTGVRFSHLAVLRSPSQPSAPEVLAETVDISVSGLLRFVLFRRPLSVNVRLQDAVFRVAQHVVPGRNGLPMGEWDPGTLPASNAGPDTRAGTEADMVRLARLVRFVQPGALTVTNAHVFLEPADFQDYGHGAEVVEIDNASAVATFPTVRVTGAEGEKSGPVVDGTAGGDAEPGVHFDGEFRATVQGTPTEGGTIAVECSLDGDKLKTVKPEDPIVWLRVVGEGVRARRIAAFLSLPFRAEAGACSADIEMDFLYKSESLVPLMRGEAMLDGVGLRFHPDPATPELNDISGKLRFDGKTLFFDGPSGSLGTLPMTVVGNIHLEDGYNLVGYAKTVDVNNVLETFDVDKFVPVQGQVRGECELTGPLEEPVVSGWAASVGKGVFDRLPLDDARMEFTWDSIAGVIDYNSIEANVTGGGKVSGEGSMYFDMTKKSPYGISKDVHSARSPKALYWNPDSDLSAAPPLQTLPKDVMEIDEQAPFRSYDSMKFDFQVSDVDGGQLLRNYGGEYGVLAMHSVGMVSGEGVLAGHLKDANCRVIWRSTTPPPQIRLNGEEADPVSPGSGSGKGPAVELNSRKERVNGSATKSRALPSGGSLNVPGITSNGEVVPADPSPSLGGGNFRGLVYLKLGDLPEARRVKARTIVKNFDARRAGWGDKELQKVLSQSPLLETSVDTFFKGVMYQRAIIPPGTKKMPRTPQMELLGADGALVVKKLNMNNVNFDSIMSGSFSFSSSDFSMSLKEVPSEPTEQPSQDVGKEGERETSSGSEPVSQVPPKELDELTISASLKGDGNFRYKRGSSEIVASLKNNENKQTAKLFTRNFAIEDIVGGTYDVTNIGAVSGRINMDMDLDITSKRGTGRITLDKPACGALKFTSVSGHLVWRDRDIVLERGTVKYLRSEYQINAGYSSPKAPGSRFGWKINVNIPRADIDDVSSLIQSGNVIARALQKSSSNIDQVVASSSAQPFWIEQLSKTLEDDREGFERWEVPRHLTLPEQVEWFMLFKEEQENLRKAKGRRVESNIPLQTGIDYSGNIVGSVSLKYDSMLGEVRQGPSSGNAVLNAILDQLARTTFSFQFSGTDWSIDNTPLDTISAAGSFEDGVLNLGPFSFQGEQGFGAEARGRITRAGSVDGSVELRRAPAGLVNKYSQAPVTVAGECSGRLEVEGNLSNPRALGRVVWTNATLNGKQVSDAKTDMACVNGRCVLNVGARIGGRRRDVQRADIETLQSLNWGRGVVSELKNLASKADSKQEVQTTTRPRDSRRPGEEAVQVRVSAPVRFYLLNYFRRRAPSSFRAALEPTLTALYPLDEEWISASADVKKYGLIFLNTVAPELGWDGGDSDINLRVAGSLSKPIVSGRISVSDGKLSPATLSEPVQALRGEVLVSKNGLVSLKSITGRCDGKVVSANGDLFISPEHRQDARDRVGSLENDLSQLQGSDPRQRRKRRVLVGRLNEARDALHRGSRGIGVDFRDIPINFQKVVLSNLSGKLQINKSLLTPSVGGSLTFSDGTIFLGNASSMSGITNETIPTDRKNAAEVLDAVSQEQSVTGRGKSDEGTEEKSESVTEQDNRREVPVAERLVENSVELDNLKVSLGKRVKLVQPFVMNIDLTGSVNVSGTSTQPDIDGLVRLMRGKVNIVASQLWLRKDERSYVKFMKQSDWERDGNRGDAEPLIQVAMEDDRVIMRVAECKLSAWSDNVAVIRRDKRSGEELGLEQSSRQTLEDIGRGGALKRFVVNAILRLVEFGCKLGFADVKLYPEFIDVRGNREAPLTKEFGVGADMDVGRMSVSSKRAFGGGGIDRFGLQILDGVNLHLENDGKRLEAQFSLTPHKIGGRKEQRERKKDVEDVEDESNANERDEEETENGSD